MRRTNHFRHIALPTLCLALLPVISGGALVASCARPPASTRDDARASIRVLVYNIHAGKDAAGQDNLERVGAIIRESGAHLVLLQEVDDRTERSGRIDQLATLARLTGMHAAFGRTLDYQGGGYGIALLSRTPLSRDTLIHLPHTPPRPRAGGSLEPRGMLLAETVSLLGSLRAVNTHLDASGPDMVRLQETDTLLALLGTRPPLPPDAHTLIGGDFNAEPGSGPHRRMVSAGWRDAWSVCGDRTDEGMTYPASSPVKRIDYLWLSPRLACRAARVLITEASDHRPLLVEVIAQR